MPVHRLVHSSLLWLTIAVLLLLAGTSEAMAWQGQRFARDVPRADNSNRLPVIQPSFPAGRRGVVSGSAGAGQATEQGDAASQRKKLEAAVTEHFGRQKDYKPEDLISRGEVEKLGKELAKLEMLPDDWRKVLDAVLPDSDELVRALRTPGGRAFMRKIAGQPGGYDRLDRLRNLPRGPQQLRDLINTPDGDKLVEYLTTTEGGKALGQQLSRSKGGRGFNESTGRIYTEADLLKRLKAEDRAAEDEEIPPGQPERGRERTQPAK